MKHRSERLPANMPTPPRVTRCGHRDCPGRHCAGGEHRPESLVASYRRAVADHYGEATAFRPQTTDSSSRMDTRS